MALCWTVTLAAGQGRRLAGVTGGLPKQFWSPDGGATLLERTLERIAPLSPVRRRVTVVDASHGPFVGGLRAPDTLGRVVYQPCDRGTAAGVLLGISEVAAADPDAIVLLTPSDHGVRRAEEYRVGVRTAIARARRSQGEIVIFGVQPETASQEHGWIVGPRTGRPRPRTFQPVRAFVEKPNAARARRLLARGAAWSTMVVVGRVRTLLDLYAARVPQLADAFAPSRGLPPRVREIYLERQYQSLPRLDFSRDLLGHATGLTFYVWSSLLGWSDLGTPAGLEAWARGEPKRPAVVLSLPGRPRARSLRVPLTAVVPPHRALAC
jgi:mannose-1-phosphate guanylyltransferase